MYTPDYTYSGTLYQDRLREAEAQRVHSQLVADAMEYRRAHGEEDMSLLSIIAQRLHLKAQSQAEFETGAEASDVRHAHAV